MLFSNFLRAALEMEVNHTVNWGFSFSSKRVHACAKHFNATDDIYADDFTINGDTVLWRHRKRNGDTVEVCSSLTPFHAFIMSSELVNEAEAVITDTLTATEVAS